MGTPQVGPLLRFAALGGVLLAMYHAPYPAHSLPDRAEAAYLRLCAAVAGALLAHLEPGSSVQGTVLLGRFPIQVGRSCDAAEPLLLLAAATLAYPLASARRRLLGLGLGATLLFALNSVRLASLELVGAAHPDVFEVVHQQLWPPVLLGVAGAVFWTWTRWATPEGPRAAT